MKTDSSPLPCTCGGAPQIMINQAFDAYAMCPNCGLRSAYVETDSIAHPRTIVELAALLDTLSEDAVMAWNSMVETGTHSPGKHRDSSGPVCGQCSNFIGMGDWDLSCIKRPGIICAETDASGCSDYRLLQI